MQIRLYPQCCTSAYCGKSSSSCPACPNGSVLAEFEQWVADTDATCPDRTWAPLVYRARTPAPAASDLTSYARYIGYRGDKTVLVSDGRVVSHRNADWFDFCHRLGQQA